jgi:hypothetical protein
MAEADGPHRGQRLGDFPNAGKNSPAVIATPPKQAQIIAGAIGTPTARHSLELHAVDEGEPP